MCLRPSTLAILAAGFLAGCLPAQDNPADTPAVADPVTVFADSRHYLERKEPERQMCGVLSRVAARTGPNTREHPVRLQSDEGAWGVYVEGIAPHLLDSYFDRPLCLTGKWVDERSQGAPIEVWIGTIDRFVDTGRGQ